jgi:hypothetical protein
VPLLPNITFMLAVSSVMWVFNWTSFVHLGMNSMPREVIPFPVTSLLCCLYQLMVLFRVSWCSRRNGPTASDWPRVDQRLVLAVYFIGFWASTSWSSRTWTAGEFTAIFNVYIHYRTPSSVEPIRGMAWLRSISPWNSQQWITGCQLPLPSLMPLIVSRF